ncbi:MAG: hypothetical protein ABSD29_16540 [Verrucomicrobiota bacterium]|jgi:hypothetical protein
MEDFRLTVTGSSEEMCLLEEFCRNYGVATERGVVSAYEGVAVTLFAVYITAPIEIVSQCVVAYRSARKAPLKVTFFVPGKGTLLVEDFSLNGLAELLRATGQLHIENAWA